MKEYRVPSLTCLRCRTICNGAMGTAEDMGGPENGSVSICLYCGALAFYECVPKSLGGGIRFREPTAVERIELLADPEIVRVLLTVREVHEKLQF